MTDIDKICRNLAEQIYESYEHFKTWFPEHMKEGVIIELTWAIRERTVVPEMVKFIDDYYNLILGSSEGDLRAKAILSKAGRK